MTFIRRPNSYLRLWNTWQGHGFQPRYLSRSSLTTCTILPKRWLSQDHFGKLSESDLLKNCHDVEFIHTHREQLSVYKNPEGQTLLMLAIKTGRVAEAHHLIDAGIGLKDGEAVDLAVEYREAEILIHLLTLEQKQAINYIFVGMLDPGLKILKEVKSKLEKVSLKRSPLYANVLIWMGYSDYKKRNFEEALQWYEEGLKIQEKLSSEEKEQVNLTYHYSYIGSSYFEKNNYLKAVEYFKLKIFILEARREKSAEDREDILTLHHKMAVSYHQMGNFEGAREEYQIVVQLHEEEFGKQDERVGMMSHNLAFFCLLLGDFEAALESYEKALSVFELYPWLDKNAEKIRLSIKTVNDLLEEIDKNRPES